MAETRKSALAKVRRAVARRAAALQTGDTKRAQTALAVARRYRAIAQRLRSRAVKPRVKHTFTSAKRWFSRPSIKPNLIVIHDAQSPVHSGYGVSDYLSRGSVQADCQLVISGDGSTYRLVPDGKKAWTQAAFNSRSLSIERAGHAGTPGPEVQNKVTAKWIAFWSLRFGIPIKDVRSNPSLSGVTSHRALGKAGGGHVDGDTSFSETLELARKYAE